MSKLSYGDFLYVVQLLFSRRPSNECPVVSRYLYRRILLLVLPRHDLKLANRWTCCAQVTRCRAVVDIGFWRYDRSSCVIFPLR